MMAQKTLDIKELTKNKLGITSTARDDFIFAIIEGIKKELRDFNGIEFSETDESLNMYISELASWRYQNAGNPSMPPYLKLWLNNLIVRGLKNESQENI